MENGVAGVRKGGQGGCAEPWRTRETSPGREGKGGPREQRGHLEQRAGLGASVLKPVLRRVITITMAAHIDSALARHQEWCEVLFEHRLSALDTAINPALQKRDEVTCPRSQLENGRTNF